MLYSLSSLLPRLTAVSVCTNLPLVPTKAVAYSYHSASWTSTSMAVLTDL